MKNATFLEGDAANLAFRDEVFDLAIDFGIVHHIPDWKNALAEIHRTLKTNGEFLFEDLSLETWQRGPGRPLKKILEHPYDHMFTKQEFIDELKRLEFEIEVRENSPAGFFNFWGRATKIS